MEWSTRTNCLDASALVKRYVTENGSADLQVYMAGEANWYTTLFCFFEALSVLKGKLGRNEICEDQYHKAGFDMMSEARAFVRIMESDLDFLDPITFSEAAKICRTHKLDLSDAFQILSVKRGYASRLVGDSQTVLVTADKKLAEAATQEGLKVKLVR